MTPEEFALCEELRQQDMERQQQPDDLAFARGLVVGLCIAACFWIMVGGGLWAALKTVF